MKNIEIHFDIPQIINFYIVVFILLFSSVSLFAQTDTTAVLNDKIFQYLEDLTENKDDSQIYELFDELLSNPIELNSATIDDLQVLPFISAINAKRIVRFIKRKNGIKNFEELNQIKNIDTELLLLLKPFVKISSIKIVKTGQPAINLRSRFIEDIQDKTNKYLGNKVKSYQRIKGSYGNFKFGGLTEKDAGEKSFADFYSGFVQYKSSGIIKNFIAGNYVFEFGQGLTVWSPYAFSKGSDATNSVSKRARNFIAYSSSDENNYFHGAAGTIVLSSLEISTFFSNNSIDGTLYGIDSISNLYTSGYHRTATELEKKNNITLTTFGISTKVRLTDYFDFSLLHYKNEFSLPFSNKDRFNLFGNNFSFSSVAYNLYFNNIYATGEFSFNGTSVASINNINFYVSKSFTFTTSVRSYPRNFYNLFSNGFGEKNSTQNELGFYIGVKWKSNYGTINTYYDIFKQPSSSFNSILPSTGNDFLLDYRYKIRNNITLNLKYKNESKEKEFTTEKNPQLLKETKSNFRIQLSYKLSKNIYGRNRIELVKYNAAINETGILTFQDIKLYWEKTNLIGRIIFFDTESYNSRIYEFENNHRGLLTNLPMYGNGFRWYFIFNYQPFPNLKISARYSETYKPKQQTLAKSKLQNTLNNRFSLQVDFRF
jgi:hypothetical protein